MYYSTFPIQEQAKRGDWNYELKSVYCIGILDFSFEEDKDYPGKYLYEVELIEKETKKIFYDRLLYVYIEIPKFKKNENELKTNTDKWIYFLKNLSRFEKIPKSLQTEMFIKAFEIAEIANFDEEQKFAYEKSMKYYRDLKNVLDKSYFDGKDEGLVEGEIIGIEKAQVEIINSMNKNGMSEADISKFTGIDIEKIKNYLKKTQ